MKNIKFSFLIFLFAAFLTGSFAGKAEDARETIMKAMKDELTRNMNNLALGELKRPCFISYEVSDAKVMTIKATLGSIIESEIKPVRTQQARVMVGDYKLNDENFFNPGSQFRETSMLTEEGKSMPLDNDYYGVRRALWIATDEIYKTAAETYEAKKSAIKQQNLTADDSTDDFSKAPKVTMMLPFRKIDFSKEKWEAAAKDLSLVFNTYKDIFTSNVSISFYQADIFFNNSEGTETIVPVTLAAVQVTATTQAPDGEPLYDHVLYYELLPELLPSTDALKKEIKQMAENLVNLRNAPVFKDNYSGPVLFEGQAVAEMLSQRLFSKDGGLIAQRKPILGDPKMMMFMSAMGGSSLEDKIDKKLFSDIMTIKATPKLKKFGDKTLIGSYDVDAEGVVPPEELMIVNKGILKTVLNGRVPTPKVNGSNGHQRYSFMGSHLNSAVGPSVINIAASEGATREELKSQLIEKAKEEGLEYAFIVRKLQSPSSGIQEELDPSAIISFASSMEKKGAVSRPIAIYKVSVKDGKEELVRTATLGGIGTGTLKKISAAASGQFVYNTMYTASGGMDGIMSFAFSFSGGSGGFSLNGIPATFIVPEALLVDELDVSQEKRPITSKLPVVDNPVGMK